MNNLITYSIVIYLFTAFILQFIRILIYYYKFYSEFITGQSVSWDIKHDRLLLLCSISFPIFSIYLFFESMDETRLYVIIIYILAITMFTALLFLMFHHADKEIKKKDKEPIQTIKQEILVIEKYDFKLNFPKDELKIIYERLIDNLFIETLSEDFKLSDEELFINILSEGKLPIEPMFKLNFDNVQTKLFFEYLSFKSEKFTLEVFLKIFKNKNPKVSAASISSSNSTSKSGAKNSKDIDSLFEFEKTLM